MDLSRFVTPNGNRFRPLMLVPGSTPDKKHPNRKIGKRYVYHEVDPKVPKKLPANCQVTPVPKKRKKKKRKVEEEKPVQAKDDLPPSEQKKKPVPKERHVACGRDAPVRNFEDAKPAGHSGTREHNEETKKHKSLQKKHLTVSWSIGSVRTCLRETLPDKQAVMQIEGKIQQVVRDLNTLKAMAMTLVNCWIYNVTRKGGNTSVLDGIVLAKSAGQGACSFW